MHLINSINLKIMDFKYLRTRTLATAIHTKAMQKSVMKTLTVKRMA